MKYILRSTALTVALSMNLQAVDTQEVDVLVFGVLGALSIGYDRVNIDITCMPETRGNDANQPGATVIAAWLRVAVARF